MKSSLKVLKTYIKNKSLRWRIMACIFVAMIVMLITLTASIQMVYSNMDVLGDSYSSNTELNHYLGIIESTERNMENYVTYHTFESIDSYYKYRNDMESFSSFLNSVPSVDKTQMEEYRVYQLTKSFLLLCDKTVSSRRANNNNELNLYYEKTLNCYNELITHLTQLNILMLQSNAFKYNKNDMQIHQLSRVSFFFFTAVTILVCLLIYFTITTITAPLGRITETANRVSKRDFDVPLFNATTTDEIGTICTAFDKMIISIREYIDTIWEKAVTEAELREKEIEMQALYADAQLKALQYQINPHFLFNTLNTGAQLAMMEEADKTSYFLEQVADFFRYNIRQDKKTASINDELGLIDNFVYIMKVRFGDRLEFKKEIESQNFPQQIPIMTLQPIVENCIKHGLKNKTGTVILKVGTEDNFVVISVRDNGCGMDEETRKSILDAVNKGNEFSTSQKEGENPGEHTGIGLSNVFLRLKKYYHNENLYDIKSWQGEGTEFIIRIPNKENV